MIILAVILLLVAMAIIVLGACVLLAPADDDPVMLETRDSTQSGGWRYRPLRTDSRRLGEPALNRH